MRCLFEEFSRTKTTTKHWKFTFVKSDVLQFKVIIFHRSPVKFSLQKELIGVNQRMLLLVTVHFRQIENIPLN